MHWIPLNFLQNKFLKFVIKNWVCPNDLHQFLPPGSAMSLLSSGVFVTECYNFEVYFISSQHLKEWLFIQPIWCLTH